MGVFESDGKRCSAKQEVKKDYEAVRDLLKNALDHAELRNQAKDAGIGRDAVVASYETLKNGYVSLEGLINKVRGETVPVPTSDAAVAGAGTEDVTASAAEIRKWAQENSFEVASTGRLAGSIIEAFGKAHTS